MTGTLSSLAQKLTSIALIAALALTSAAEISTTSSSLLLFPNTNASSTALNAAIKTQAAANRLLQKGAVKGIDVSRYQGSINWRSVAKDGVKFTFIRATCGTTRDSYFTKNATSAYANGIKVGAYHYATFKNRTQMKKEAALFLSQVKKVNINYPLVLDIEALAYTKMNKSTVTTLAREFLDILKAEGYSVMLYSYNDFFDTELNMQSLKKYDLWIANYSQIPTSQKHEIWQHTSSGRVNGISGNVDINIAYKNKTYATVYANGKTSFSGSTSSSSSSSGSTSSSSKTSSSSNTSSSTSTSTKTVKVSKTISDSIKSTLNKRYSTGLPTNGLDMTRMNAAIATGIQKEIAKQWGVSLKASGKITAKEVSYLNEVNWSRSTRGNITYLLQAKLFYDGYYTGSLTAKYDSKTISAVKAFQKDNGLTATGFFDYASLYALLI